MSPAGASLRAGLPLHHPGCPRSPSVHSPSTFAASWHESRSISKEEWSDPPSPAYVSQFSASHRIDSSILERLVSSASPRGAQLLSRASVKHAGAWVSASPSWVDGMDTVMRPRVFRTAVLRLLSLPVLAGPAPCPLCKQTMDVYGDHSLCCRMTRDNITRHNRVRNLVFNLASAGRLSPEMEKLGILGETDRSRRRPGDVSLPLWSGDRGLAIDVAVVCPLTESRLASQDPCEDYARTFKHHGYDAGFVGSRYDFVTMVFESTGAVCSEGEEVLRQLMRFAALRRGSSSPPS